MRIFRPGILCGGFAVIVAVGLLAIYEPPPQAADAPPTKHNEEQISYGKKPGLPEKKTELQNALLAMLPAAGTARDPASDSNMPPNSPSIEAIAALYERSTSASEIVRGLVELLPTLPPEDQADAAQYLVFATEDRDYHLVGALLLGGKILSPEANDVLLADLAQRQPAVSLPVWNALAASPQHPLRTAARQHQAEKSAEVSIPAGPR